MKKFSDLEKKIIQGLDPELEWIARDKNGQLNAFEKQPYKGVTEWKVAAGNFKDFPFEGVFKAIRWEDPLPVRVWDILRDVEISNLEEAFLKAAVSTGLKPEDLRIQTNGYEDFLLYTGFDSEFSIRLAGRFRGKIAIADGLTAKDVLDVEGKE